MGGLARRLMTRLPRWMCIQCYASTARLRRSASTSTLERRDYAAAVAALNTLQSNFSVVDAIRRQGRSLNQQSIPEMLEWCRKAGYQPSDFNHLRPIHIAGTKGKGSTSAIISSILAQYKAKTSTSKLPSRIGLYTSPHLRSVRERIQLDNTPIAEDVFAKYFFEIWDKLDAVAKAEQLPVDIPSKPVYFRYLTLMALHTYLSEGVDTAIIECGIGGEFDSTNVFTKPTVTAITSLGIDHTAMLGSTIQEIAWHKAGIFKHGSIALTAPQKDEALTVLRERAAEKETQLHVINLHPALGKNQVKLGLQAEFQKTNASVAIVAAAVHLRSLGHTTIPDPTLSPYIELPAEFIRGLEQVRWPGRCEIRREPNIAWYIDGGHTIESIEFTGRWFAEQIAPVATATTYQHRTPCILIFNQQTRDASALAEALHSVLQDNVMPGSSRSFTHVIFTTNQTFIQGYKPDLASININQEDVNSLAVQNILAQTWSRIDNKAEVHVLGTIEESIKTARNIAFKHTKLVSTASEVAVLITGSLHLIGGALEVLESDKN